MLKKLIFYCHEFFYLFSFYVIINKKQKGELGLNYVDLIEKRAALNSDVKYNPLQNRIVENKSNNMILAHPVGSGKTLSGIAKFEDLKKQGRANKALVVTPAGLRQNYAEDGVQKFTNSKYNVIGNKAEIQKKTGFDPNPNADYNIISYEKFRSDPKKYLKETGADTLIVDEIQKLRNPGTSTLNSFKDTSQDYKNLIGLTGSVVSNKISDIYNLVDLASHGNHNLGKSQKDFESKFLRRSMNPKYMNMSESRRPIVGFKNKKVLEDELRKYIDYADIDDVRDMAKIPPSKINTIKVPMSQKQAKIYKQLLNDNPKLRKLILQKKKETLRDDEVASAYNQMIEARKLMNSVGSVIPKIPLSESAKITPKTKKLLDDMEEHLKNTPDGQAVLLTNLINGGSDVLEAGLKERGIEGVTEESRQQDVRDYKNNKKRVMVLSGAGAEGISLGNTTWEGVLDPHYNPERMNQMEARGIRAFGQSNRPEDERLVNVNRYISTMPKTLGIIKSKYKTPDEAIYEIAENKRKQNELLTNLLKDMNKPKEKNVLKRLLKRR